MKRRLVSIFLCSIVTMVTGVVFYVSLRPVLPLGVAAGCHWLLTFLTLFLFSSVGERMDSHASLAPPEPKPEEEKPVRLGKRGFELYQRASRYMEEQRPFLDDQLDLDQFSRAIFSNKVYVSKAINYYSGKNFRQFLNWYRIQHALELMKKDPHLRMEEVSTLSGFHSTVSFNMAFRLFQGKTPTAWHEEYVDSLRKQR